MAAQMELEEKQKEVWEAAQAQARQQAQHCDGQADLTHDRPPPNIEDYAIPFGHKMPNQMGGEVQDEAAASTSAFGSGHATSLG